MKTKGHPLHEKRAALTVFRGIFRNLILSSSSVLCHLTGQMTPLLKKDRVQFLHLHDVFADEETAFRRFLQRLSQKHVFISYSEAVNRIRNGGINRPYLCLSFDDGFKSCLRAAEIMKQLGIKGCFFLCSSMIGETDHERIKEFCAKKLLVCPNEFLSWDDVEQLLEQGNEIGSHTSSHPNMSRLSNDELSKEIFQAREVLGRKVGAVKHFSWPFGRFSDFSAVAAKTVFEAGFESCASGVRGCHVARSEGTLDLCIRRDHIVATWPLSHVLYLMARNSQKASASSNQWPKEWEDTLRDQSSCG